MSRLPLLALALAVLATAGVPLAHADAAPPAATVTIAPSSGGPARTLDLATLADRFDVHGATYTLRAADGTTSTTTVAEGISVGALLDAAGIARDAFGYLTVPGLGGASALVLADDVAGTDQGQPVVWSDAQGLHFLRPVRNDSDVNAEDLVTAPDGTLTLQLGTGDPVKPQVSVSTLHPRVGNPVEFTASLAVGALRPGWGYAWYLGDGSGLIPGATITHRFRRADTYPTQVNVVDASGRTVGPAGIVYLRVAAARARPAHGAHGAGDGRDGGAGAGTGSGGGTGAAGGSGSGTSGTGAAAPAYVPLATPPAASPPPTPVPAPSHASPTPREQRGDLVSGTLIASASAAATPAGGAQAARAVERGATSDGPLHVPVGVWVAVGLALLLALGWVLESRHTLPFWQP